MNRREFLKGVGAASAMTATVGLLDSCWSPVEALIDPNRPQALRFPPTISGGSITSSYGSALIWAGPASSVITVNGSFIGPTVRISRGAEFNARFFNSLGEDSIIHWHGLNVPDNMDGHPRSAIASGASFLYSFPIHQRGGTYWYHAHPDRRTGSQVYKGFAGAFIIDDPAEATLGLPSGKFDLPLMIQDKRRGRDNALTYDPSEEDILTGYLGDSIVVNGTGNAYFDAEQNRYRLRLINGSNARVLRIGFEDNRSFQLIATDAGLIESPQELTSFNLSPGERADILVDLSGDNIGSTVQLVSLSYVFDSSHRGATFPQGMALKILEFRIKDVASLPLFKLPGTLSQIAKLSNPAKTRIFRLTMDHSKHTGVHMINDLVFEMNRIDEVVPFNQVEMWEFQNTADAFHSMHLHGGQFQVIERLYADPMTPVDFGWKDTVLVYPNETVRVLICQKDYKGLFLLHCHTLEHEDDGMMINLSIV